MPKRHPGGACLAGVTSLITSGLSGSCQGGAASCDSDVANSNMGWTCYLCVLGLFCAGPIGLYTGCKTGYQEGCWQGTKDGSSAFFSYSLDLMEDGCCAKLGPIKQRMIDSQTSYNSLDDTTRTPISL